MLVFLGLDSVEYGIYTNKKIILNFNYFKFLLSAITTIKLEIRLIISLIKNEIFNRENNKIEHQTSLLNLLLKSSAHSLEDRKEEKLIIWKYQVY